MRRGAPPQRPPAQIKVITGPPCAGKSTYVDEHRQPGDVVLDLDRIAFALGYPDQQITWDDDHPAAIAARMARAHVIYSLLNGKLKARAWIIDARPERTMRPQYERAGAEFISIDPGMTVCLERAKARGEGVAELIRAWYTTSTSESQALDIFR